MAGSKRVPIISVSRFLREQAGNIEARRLRMIYRRVLKAALMKNWITEGKLKKAFKDEALWMLFNERKVSPEYKKEVRRFAHVSSGMRERIRARRLGRPRKRRL